MGKEDFQNSSFGYMSYLSCQSASAVFGSWKLIFFGKTFVHSNKNKVKKLTF